MFEKKLHFNYKDIFLSPRLALSPKKIWVFILGNLYGYIAYWVLSFMAMILSGVEINEALYDYGLYPYLSGTDFSTLSWLIYYAGIIFWAFSILASSTAVSSITIRQLRGDNFYSVNDAFDQILKKWKTILFTPVTLILILLVLIMIGGFFAILGSISFIGPLLVVITYPLLFLGSIFLIFSYLVFISSFSLYPSAVGAYDEDTIGSVFHAYHTTFNQPWRIFTYNILLLPLVILSMKLLSWFCQLGFNLINLLFEQVIGSSYSNVMSYALSVLNLDFILANAPLYEITFLTDAWNLQNLVTVFVNILTSLFAEIFNIILSCLPLLEYSMDGGYISSVETIAGLILSISFIFLYLSVLSYGFSIVSVGQTIIFIIFKKLNDDENLLLNNPHIIDKDSTRIENSSAEILDSISEEE